MKIRFLGTGTSTGVPQIGCRCEVCCSSDSRDKRLRSSVRIEVNNTVLIIDCSPDFRYQVMKLPFGKLDGVLFTHEHYDHVGGIDDLRPFSRFGSVSLYMEKYLENILRERMPYCFAAHKYKGIPDINIMNINVDNNFNIGSVEITPIRVMHFRLPILGYRIQKFAYLTDVKTITESEFEKLIGLDTLVISALRKSDHISHLSLNQSIEISRKIGATNTYFTHMSHEMGLHKDIEKELPQGMFFAYDGLEITSL